MVEETVNACLFVALSGESISKLDPRPVVAEFVKKKDRRYREPTYSYRNREFAVKFFSGGRFDIGCVSEMRLLQLQRFRRRAET